MAWAGVEINMLGTVRRPALLPAALLALATAWLCAPAALRASCGDYVTLGPRSPGAVLPRTPPVPAPAPCHGPRCSGGSLPPLLPLTVAPDTPEQWGHLARPRPAADPGRFVGWSGQDLGPLPESTTSIYHPPRLGPAATSLL